MKKPTNTAAISKAKEMFGQWLVRALLFCILYWTVSATAIAQNYTSSEIVRDLERGPYVLEDINGDGLMDMITARWEPNLGRELWVFRQQPGGRFATVPQRIEIKTEIVAVGFADLRDDPGKELLLFANSGVFSLSTATEGYAGNLKPLFDWKLIADVPDPEEVEFIRNIRDLDGDGHIDLLLPGEKTWGYFRGSGNEQFTQAGEFSSINTQLDPSVRPSGDGGLSASVDINARDGIKLVVRAGQPTPFAGFVEDWENTREDNESLLRAENFMPTANLADFDGDGREDIVFINVGEDIRGQVNLLFQRSDGTFSNTPDWQGPVETRGELELADFDGDGLSDFVRITGDGNEWDVYLFRNLGARFDFDQPDQIMRFSGYDLNLDFHDIDQDGQPELNVSYYTIPVVEAIRNASIVRTQLLYSRDTATTGQLFSRRPQSRLEESFSATNVRGLAEQMSLRYDVDGDGRLDALYITGEGALAARKIDDGLRIAEEPFWQFVPNRTVLGFSVLHLNDDNLPDLILRHQTAFTLLVATQ